MKIGITGAGISGLAAAYKLTKMGHRVVVFEKSDQVGGLAAWTKIGEGFIEKYYHHIFESDQEIIKLTKELGLAEKLKFYRAKTGIFSGGHIYPFSTPSDLLRFSPLSLFDRLRCGVVFGGLRLFPFPLSSLDRISANEWISRSAGKNVYRKIWGPLLEGKFSHSARAVPALWLWGRIKDRTLKLGYLDGSVKTLFDALRGFILKSDGLIKLRSEVLTIVSNKNSITVKTRETSEIFDKVLLTTISPLAAKLIKNDLPGSYRKSLTSIDHLGTVCVLVELKHPVQSQYWLNICESKAPVLVMVEHTNMINKEHYGGKSIVYLANYLHQNDKRFSEPDETIFSEYIGFLKKINKHFNDSWIVDTHIFRSSHAQTIFKIGSLLNRPSIETPIPNIYMVNIDQMYPHDRNLNQGALLGKQAVNLILKK